MDGLQFLILSSDGTDYRQALLETRSIKGESATWVRAGSPDVEETRLLSAKGDDGVHIRLVADGREIDFRGRSDRGTVRGTALIDNSALVQAWLEPTTAQGFQGINPSSPTAERDVFAARVRAGSDSALRAFSQEHGTSPLAVDAAREALRRAAARSLTEPEAERLASTYRQVADRWGLRCRQRANIEIVRILVPRATPSNLLGQHVRQARDELSSDVPEAWHFELDRAEARWLLKDGPPDEGLRRLQQLHARAPYDPETGFVLARALEQAGRDAEALDLWARLAALPQMDRAVYEALAAEETPPPIDQLPTRRVRALWFERHGSASGLSDFLDTAFDAALAEWFPPRATPTTSADESSPSPRHVLVELFTSSDCLPCVAADLAVSGLERTVAPRDVVVLRYHQHVGRIDPLANLHTLRRAEWYQIEGTPAVFLNGREVSNLGGTLLQTPRAFQRLSAAWSTRHSALPNGTLAHATLAATASRTAEGIAVRGAIQGCDSLPATVSLRVVLCEDRLRHTSANGIRLHDGIVRWVPRLGVAVKPEEGQLTFSTHMSLDKVRNDVQRYLNAVDSSSTAEPLPPPPELKNVHVVVFLQDNESHAVWQVQFVEVPPLDEQPSIEPSAG